MQAGHCRREPGRTIRPGEDGSLWIELSTASPDTARWVVIEADGSLRGRLDLPVGMDVRYAAGSTVWVVESDALDVPWLVRLRVERQVE